MYSFFVLAVLVPVILSTNVVPLTRTTYDELARHPISLVKYYAPWCGHCKRLKPYYEKAATTLKKNDPSVTLFEVNCDEETALCNSENVKGYPTLKIYENGKHIEDYQGVQEDNEIVSHMAALAGPTVSEISKIEDYDSLVNDETVIALQTKNKEIEKEFSSVARKLRKELKFVHTKERLFDASKDTLIQISLPKRLETKLEERSIVYNGSLEAADIEKWVRENAAGIVGIRDEKHEQLFKKPLLVAYTMVDFVRNPANIRYYRNRMIEAAQNTKSNLQFALSDTGLYAGELHRMGLTLPNSRPAVVIMAEDGKFYVMQSEFGIEQLKSFVNNFVAGTLEPFIKSEPIPEKQEGHVTKVVGKNFEDIVLDTTKDVLIEFYAPWCGHCKAFQPKYEEIAKKLSEEKDIVIAAIDAEANAYPPIFNVQGYPTVYWVPKNSKKSPQQYNGAREVKNVLEFIAKSATKELTYYTRDGKRKQEEL